MEATKPLLPISALQHLLFCPRQCALIHLEGQWADNRLTVQGNLLHRNAHEAPPTTRDGVRTARGIDLVCHRLGLIGKSDIVEFTPPPPESKTPPPEDALRQAIGPDVSAGGNSNWPPRSTPTNAPTSTLAQAIAQARADGTITSWQVTPVEYKRGKPKANRCDEVQLAAQALCLEEMLGVRIDTGQLYYGLQRRRTDVAMDEKLRAITEDAASRLHVMIDARKTPSAHYEKKCDRCSLKDLCLPTIADQPGSTAGYVKRMLKITS